MKTFDWTPERVDQLKQLWLVDGLTALQVAKILGGGVTRNAICGKVHRLGWERGARRPTTGRLGNGGYRKGAAELQKARERSVTARSIRPATPKRQVQTQVYAARIAPMPLDQSKPIVIDITQAKPWLERKTYECAYIVAGEGADSISCAAKCDERGYCSGHRKLMFEKPQRPTERRARWARAA